MNTKKIIGALTLAVLISTAVPGVEAAKTDPYRDILLNGVYTIKYDNITPARRTTNRDKTELFGKSGMAVEKNDYLTNRQKSGFITDDGQNRYEEVGDGVFNMCRLTKNDENYFFTKYKKGDSYEYYGTKKNQVEASYKNNLAEAFEGQSYGDYDVSRLLNAMIPAAKKSANQTTYKFVAAGSLPSGLNYEDYVGMQGEVNSVIRYYFKGNDLVKIAAAEYFRKADGGIDGYKCIIKINEFSAVPDKSVLKLPDGVKDVTKRDKNNKIKEKKVE